MNGEDLKKRREELGLSLTEVSLVTKISLRVLHAIEAMDKAQLPAGIFLKGLVKSYALHLKLDADTVTKSYLAILNPTPQPPIAPIGEANNAATAQVVEHTTQFEKPNEKLKEKVAETKTEKNQSEPFRIPIQAIGIGVAIVAVVIMLIVGQKMNSYKSEVAVTITQTPDETKANAKPEEKPVEKATEAEVIPMLQGNMTTEKPVDSAAVTTTATTPFPVPIPGTAVTPPAEEVTPPPAQPVVTAPPTPTPPAPAPASTTVAKVEEKPKIEKPAEVKPEIKAEVKVETKPEVKPEIKTVKSKQLIFEALDKVNIVIKKGGKQYRVSLQPDEIHTVNYSETIEVEVSDGGAVNLIQNGHDNGVAGDLGKPKKMSL